MKEDPSGRISAAEEEDPDDDFDFFDDLEDMEDLRADKKTSEESQDNTSAEEGSYNNKEPNEEKGE